jgi:hypothetical protein
MFPGMHEARTNPVTRLYRLTSARRKLLMRALLMLSAASAAVALLPFRRAIRFGSVARQSGEQLLVADCIWAVRAAAKRLPWRTVCIEQGLTAQRMLRRAGIDAVLHYGARREPGFGKLEAHVWVTVAGRAILGGEEAQDFAEITSYP